MQVKVSSRGSNIIVSLIGELDHHSAQVVRNKIDAEIVKASTKAVVIDFSKITFMDSSGIGVVVGRYKNLKELNGYLVLVGLSPQIKRIFEMSGILRQIRVFDSIDMAISCIAG
jgi:anti-sigma F factor antagonist